MKIEMGGSQERVFPGMTGKILLWIQGLIIYLSSLLITGYHIYTANQVLVIPLVYSFNTPSLYPNDPYVSTLMNYAAPVWRLIGELTNFIPLETLLTLLFLTARALILIAAARLAMTLNPGSKLSAVGAMAFFAMWPSPLIGHGTLVNNYFEHTGLSLAFLLLAAADFYSKRRYYWAIWLAIGFTLNSMYGTYACLYFLAVFLVDADYRANWKKWIPPAAVFLILASPTIFITASAFRIEVIDKELWLRVSEIRFPHHLYPLTWLPVQFITFFAFVLYYSAVLFGFRKESNKLYKFGMVWLGVGLFWLIFAYAAAYVAKSPAMLVMHPARGTDLWFAFAIITTIAVFARLIEMDHLKKRLFVILFFFSILWYYLFDFTWIITIILVIIAIGVGLKPAWNWVYNQGNAKRLSNIVILVVIIFAAYTLSGSQISEKIGNPIGYPDAQMREIANWAGEATSIEDVFLVDPNWSEFRSISQRPIFVTWKDGSAILWERSYVEEWVERIEALGYNIDEPKAVGMSSALRELLSKRYNSIDDEYVLVLSGKYPIRYWIVPIDHTSSFQVVFQTTDYKVLLLQSPDEGS